MRTQISSFVNKQCVKSSSHVENKSDGGNMQRNRMYAYSKDGDGKFLSHDSSIDLDSAWTDLDSDWMQTIAAFRQPEPGWKHFFFTTIYKRLMEIY